MAYLESANGIRISKARALLECKRHGIDGAELLAELGDCAEYSARAVLVWLGY